MLKRLIPIVLIATCGFLFWSQRSVGRDPGVLAPQPPLQAGLAGVSPFQHTGQEITPIARFELNARVLAVKRYRFDRGARLAPYDLALGWGRMSDTAVLDRIDVSQSGRFYFWRTKDFPIPMNEIISSSANMHIVPANDAVRSALGWLRPGHLVTIRGKLIMAKAPDGGVWLSSTTREDSGNGACELVWVEELDYR